MGITIATMQMCKSLQGKEILVPSESGRGLEYIVWTGAIEQSTPHCTCDSFKFQQGVGKYGECKHIRNVMKGVCGWHPQWCDERQSSRQEKTMTCPRCKGPTVSCRVAV